MSEPDTNELDPLLELMKRNRGFDFTGYKRTTLVRRIRKRMSEVGMATFGDYTDLLESEPAEFAQLFNTILINVTSFFRDEDAWATLRAVVIEELAKSSDPLRVWSAGYASGEETLTLVMLLAEALGVERFKQQVKVYATDADEQALEQARAAVYGEQRMASVPESWRTKYFEPNHSGFVFRNDVRRCIIFGRHDLINDPPISRLDLIVCRNTLIYFNAETQARILERFNFGLKHGGHLFLGRAELLLTHAHLFAPVNLDARIFRKVSGPDLRDRLGRPEVVRGRAREEGAPTGALALTQAQRQVQMREVGFEGALISQIILDLAGNVVLANLQARRTLGVDRRDIGRPIQDLQISYRPYEIRSCIEEASQSRAPVSVQGVAHRDAGGNTVFYDIQVEPLLDEDGELLGTSISFVDVTAAHLLRLEVERSRHELETAYEEVQSTNEELETTNEELQSSMEEMETTNEELQSTNEELETMNEELQSTNQELETMNHELSRRTHELNSLNEFMDLILTSMRSAVVVTDADLHVQVWNYTAEDLWGLRASEVEGKVLTKLDVGLPFDSVAGTLQKIAQGREHSQDIMLDAVNRRGKSIKVRLSCNRLATGIEDGRGLLILMEVIG